MRFLVPVFAAAAMFPASAAAPKIAVLNFTNNTGGSGLSYLAAAIPDAISSNLAASGKIAVVERVKMKNVLDEIALQQTGLFEASQVTQVGKMYKADLLLIGSYSGQADNLTVTMKVVRVQTAQVLDGRTLRTTLEKIFDSGSQAILSMLPVILGQDTGFLTVRTNPEGAEVYLDGGLIGISPVIDYKVGAGSYRVQAVRRGYFAEDKTVDIARDEHASWSPSLGRRRHSSYVSLSAGMGYFFPQPAAVKGDLDYFGRLQYFWKSFHIGAELGYTSLKHDQEVANPFGGNNITIARRYRTWTVLADFAYYPFPAAQIVSPYAGIFGGYVYMRDVYLESTKYEAESMTLNGAALGGKIGVTFLPQAGFNFFVEARYYAVYPAVSRKIFGAPTVTQNINVKGSEDITFSGVSLLFGFTLCFD